MFSGKKVNTIILMICLLSSIFTLALNTPKVEAATYSYTNTFRGLGHDGEIYKTDSVYVTPHNATTGESIDTTSSDIQIGQKYTAAVYDIWRGFLFFDTSSIPDDATVTAAILSLNTSNIETNYFNLTLQNGQPLYPNTPLALGDYYYDHYSGNGGTIITSALIENSYVNITLTEDGESWINIEEVTRIALLSDQDINYTAPINDAHINIYSAESGEDSSPILYVTYSMSFQYNVNLHGPYAEDGTRNYDGINCTFTRPNQATLSFELNGTYAATAQTDTRLVITSDVGGNYSRIYYLRYDQWYEDIYIFYPDELFATYYFTIVDFIGIEHGYLESILNVNGTDRIIERQKVDVSNEIPFILSWGSSYKFRLVCDSGSYIWESIIAAVDTSIVLTVSTLTFPADPTTIYNITLSAERTDGMTITALYSDAEELTNWVYIEIYEYGTTEAIYSTNNTGNEQSITWDEALPNSDYIVYFEIDHIDYGSLYWSFSCFSEITGYNPWSDFEVLGDWGSIDSTQIIAAFIVLAVFGGFSMGSVDVGIVATLLTAGVLNLIGWLNIPWDYFTIIFAFGLIVLISLRRRSPDQ